MMVDKKTLVDIRALLFRYTYHKPYDDALDELLKIFPEVDTSLIKKSVNEVYSDKQKKPTLFNKAEI